jgi:hypothetical protein
MPKMLDGTLPTAMPQTMQIRPGRIQTRSTRSYRHNKADSQDVWKYRLKNKKLKRIITLLTLNITR